MATIFAFCVIVLFRNWHYGNVIVTTSELFRAVAELFMFQEVGPFPRGINGPVWYVSVLIVGGGLLYSLAYKSKRFITCIAPCIAIFGYTYLVDRTNGNFDEFYTVGLMRLPFLRGLSGMSLGMLVGALSQKKEQFLRPVFMELMFFVCLTGMTYCLISEANWDIYFCFFSAVVIYICLSGSSLINKVVHHDIFVKLGDITFDMLLLHFPINILVYHSIGIHLVPQLSVLLCWIVNVALAFLYNYLFKKIKQV